MNTRRYIADYSEDEWTLVQHLDGYVDFERYPPGFGSDGQARIERITYVEETGLWYGAVRHTEPDGEDTYSHSTEATKRLDLVLRWLKGNRKADHSTNPKTCHSWGQQLKTMGW